MFTKQKIILKLQQRFKIEAHDVNTQEINKISLRSNQDMRLKTSYPYGSYIGKYVKVCKPDYLNIVNIKWLKIKQNINQNGHIVQIIHKEY